MQISCTVAFLCFSNMLQNEEKDQRLQPGGWMHWEVSPSLAFDAGVKFQALDKDARDELEIRMDIHVHHYIHTSYIYRQNSLPCKYYMKLIVPYPYQMIHKLCFVFGNSDEFHCTCANCCNFQGQLHVVVPAWCWSRAFLFHATADES